MVGSEGRSGGLGGGGRRAAALALALGAALAWAGAGCTTVAEHRKLEHEVNKLKRELAESGSSTRAAELRVELERLRERVSELEGRVEVVEHDTAEAVEVARQARRDAAAPAGSAPSEGAAGEPEGARSEEGEGEGASPAEGEVGAAPSGAPEEGARAAATPEEEGGGAGVAGGEAASAAPEELAAYREAYGAWRSDEHGRCIDRFRSFLQSYPASDFADDARYWMADCFFEQGDYKTAILRFDDVVSKHPASEKAADALFRQGEALLELEYREAARKAFERVMDEYPESRRAAEAERQLELLRSG